MLAPWANRRDQAALAAMLGGLKASFARVRGGSTENFLLTGGAASNTSATFLGWIVAPRFVEQGQGDAVAGGMAAHDRRRPGAPR